MLTKLFKAVPEFTQDEPGQVTARFATLNAVDSDGDVILPGAFGEQTVRMQPYGHDTWALPIGKGTVHEDGDEAIADLKINLDLASDHYSALKFDFENGPPQIEWSFVFDVEQEETGEFEGQDVRFLKRLKVHSVDPVFLGAGVNTATMQVKSLKETLALPADATAEQVVESLTATIKSEYPDFADLVTVSATGANPDDGSDDDTASFVDQAKHALSDVQGLIESAETLVASLREKDETLTDSKRESLEELCSAVASAQARLADVLKPKEEPVVPPPRRLATELRMVELRSQVPA